MNKYFNRSPSWLDQDSPPCIRSWLRTRPPSSSSCPSSSWWGHCCCWTDSRGWGRSRVRDRRASGRARGSLGDGRGRGLARTWRGGARGQPCRGGTARLHVGQLVNVTFCLGNVAAYRWASEEEDTSRWGLQARGRRRSSSRSVVCSTARPRTSRTDHLRKNI